LNLSHRLPAGPGGLTGSTGPSDSVATVTMTDSKSNIESESVSQYAQAAHWQRVRVRARRATSDSDSARTPAGAGGTAAAGLRPGPISNLSLCPSMHRQLSDSVATTPAGRDRSCARPGAAPATRQPAAVGFGGRLLAGAGLKIPPRIEGQTMQGFLSCSALEGRPIAAFIFGWYIQHNPCFIHVAKFALFNRVFSFVVQKQIAPYDRS